jgi:hypothetical protein
MQRPQLNPSIDIVNIGLENNGDFLSLFIETNDDILTGGNGMVDTFMVFIDYDLDEDTGYRIDYLGADYMAMIYGIDGELKGSTLHEFDALKDPNDWSGWKSIGNLVAASNDKRLEAQVSWDQLGDGEKQVDALFYSQDYGLGEDFADHVVSNVKGVLTAQVHSSETETYIGGNNPVLEITLEAIEADIELTELSISLMGTADVSEIGNLRLVDSATDNTLEQVAPASKDVAFSLDTPLLIDDGGRKDLAVLVDVIGFSGHTLGATIESSRDIRIETGPVSLEVLPSDRGMGYIGFIPQNFTIDGGFSDWTTPVPDNDVLPISNQDIDINEYDLASEDESFYFYVNVKGEMLDGTEVPFRNRIKGEPITGGPIDTDRDTVPDSVDPLPYNFDNQGLDDAETDNDVDADEIKDYPHGNDYWLNTTIPASFPAPYAGKPVSIFIGPITKPLATGEDFARIYLDTDGISGNGYDVQGFGADYLIEIKGKHSIILSKEVFRFAGQNPGQWIWDSIDEVDQLAVVQQSLEGRLDVSALGLISPSYAFIETSDWYEEKDFIPASEQVKGLIPEGTKHSQGATAGGGLVAKPTTATVTINGQIDAGEWTDAAYDDGSCYGGFCDVYMMHDDDYLYVRVDVNDNDMDDGEWVEIYFDSSHDDGSSVDADDYRFRIKRVAGTTMHEDADGAAWGTDDNTWTDGAVGDAGSYLVYEFKIPLTGSKKVWDYSPASAPRTGEIAGFDVRLYHDLGTVPPIYPETWCGYTEWTRSGGSGGTDCSSPPASLSDPRVWGDLFFDKPMLLITEVSSYGTGKSGGQFNEGVELHNEGPDSINLNGITIDDQDAEFSKSFSTSDVTTELNIASGQYVVIWTADGTDETTGPGANGYWDFYLDHGNNGNDLDDNDGDDLWLYYTYNGMGIDYMEYGTDSGTDADSCPSSPESWGSSANGWDDQNEPSAPSSTSESANRKWANNGYYIDNNKGSDWFTTPYTKSMGTHSSIPEFPSIIYPVVLLLLSFLIVRRKKKRKES